MCKELDCGSAASTGRRNESSNRAAWEISPDCVESGSALNECLSSGFSSSIIKITCSDSVRLVNGTSLCSGRLEVKSDQSNQSNQSNQWWSSVCEADFDQRDAEVVCRELGCGAPSVLWGALYGEVEAPMLAKEFQCEGNESALLDCRSSGSDRNTCSPGKAVGLTCLERVRLVGGSSRCAGALEVKRGEWRPVFGSNWTLTSADVMCKELDCGSAASTGRRNESSNRAAWEISPDCVESGSALNECLSSGFSSSILKITCSDSVRLVNGTSLCSGRLEVKSDQSNQSNQSNQWWSLVCEADFDQRDAEVVCRELGCGAPSVLWGALYGEVEAPMWTKEFHCEGNESALLDCRSAGSAGNTCSPGKAVGLTCSERVRLVGGSSRCAGALEVKQGDWRPVYDSNWTLTSAAEVCRELHCGSVVSTELRIESTLKSSWEIRPDCVQSGSALRECMSPMWSSSFLEVTCSGPTVSSIGLVRLVVLSLGLLLLITVVCVTHQVTFIALLIKAPAQMKHFACEY
uniref:SRCR domain-containing protein n=1 Tax=Sparus aurata TaxID=8175 RepID=A0A671Y312_SPAAU